MLVRDVAARLQRLGAVLVQLNVARPLAGDVVCRVNRFDGAFGHARFAVDAIVRVDVQHHVVLVEALDGANDAAVRVLAIVATFRHDVSHVRNLHAKI